LAIRLVGRTVAEDNHGRVGDFGKAICCAAARR
jgi:hypothetical protein